MMKTTGRTILASIGSGLLLGLAFPRYHLFFLAWVALVPLLAMLARRPSPRETFQSFFVAGLTFYLVLLHWLLSNVYWAGGWAVWGYVGLCAFMACYWGLLGLCARFVYLRLSPVPRVLSFATLWAGMEVLQGWLFSGFGWGAIAYSQGPDLLLVQWASIGGYALVGFWVALANAALAMAATERASRRAAVMVLVVALAASHGVGYALLDEPDYGAEPYYVGLVQADFPLEMKWDWEYTAEMVRNAAAKSSLLAANEPVDLFVWPEALVMDDIEEPSLIGPIAALTTETGAWLLTGAHRAEEEGGASLNSSYLVGPDGAIHDHYDKIHLAPFGEYVPLAEYFPFIGKIVPAIGDLKAGSETKVFEAKGRNLGPLICFEVLFSPMSLNLRAQGADMLAVLTNLGWFGASSALPQELEIARLRAIETRLPLVHCANTGISGVFDPYGRFAHRYGAMNLWGNYVEVDGIPLEDTIMRRLSASLPVARPAASWWPLGPRWFPLASLLAGLAVLCAAALRRPARDTR